MLGISGVVFLFAFVGSGYAHKSVFGTCPDIRSEPHFDISKFFGKWYAIEKSESEAPCVEYVFSNGEEPGNFWLDQTSYSRPNYPVYHYKAHIWQPHPSDPAKMKMSFKFTLKSYRFNIFATDYNQYAGIFVCQNFGLFHRRQIIILARDRTLSESVIIELRNKLLESYHMDLSDLKSVDQHVCLAQEMPHPGHGNTQAVITQSVPTVASEVVTVNPQEEELFWNANIEPLSNPNIGSTSGTQNPIPGTDDTSGTNFGDQSAFPGDLQGAVTDDSGNSSKPEIDIRGQNVQLENI